MEFCPLSPTPTFICGASIQPVKFLFLLLLFFFLFAVNFVIHWNEKALGIPWMTHPSALPLLPKWQIPTYPSTKTIARIIGTDHIFVGDLLCTSQCIKHFVCRHISFKAHNTTTMLWCSLTNVGMAKVTKLRGRGGKLTDPCSPLPASFLALMLNASLKTQPKCHCLYFFTVVIIVKTVPDAGEFIKMSIKSMSVFENFHNKKLFKVLCK